MYKHLKKCLGLFLLLTYGGLASAEISLRGYASIVAGRADTGNEFLADYPKYGSYDEEWSFSPDTSFGIQLQGEVNDNTSIVIQAVSNGALDYDIDLDWAYIKYQLNPELSIQAGRKRLPLYFYSDYFDVGYAYYWIRPPTDNYTWQITNYNGLSLLYQPQLSEWDALFNVYVGREDSDDNRLLSSLSQVPVDETWRNMLGAVAELSQDWIELRFTFMQGKLDRVINDIIAEQDVKQQFTGMSANFYFGNFIFLSELNQYRRTASDIRVVTSMVSLGYQIGDFTPHLTHSSLDQKDNQAGGDEAHETTSIGVRWDLDRSIALKLQFDRVEDNGVIIPVLGDSKAISFGLDIVF